MNNLVQYYSNRYREYLETDYGKWYTKEEIEEKIDCFNELAKQINYPDNLPRLFNLVVKSEKWKV